MRNLSIYITITILVTLFLSCTSQPTVVEEIIPPEDVVEKAVIIPENTPDRVVEDTLDENEIKEAETDISILIEELNKIITSEDFTNWKNHLSQNYIDYYSDQEVLKEKSLSPLLKKYKIVLRSLEDYFNFVVVGSRQNVKLDEIKVLDRDRIKAYMYINNTAVIIYELVRIDNTWKIGKFLE